ncbi:hypothetical protein I7I50_08889 [Histoplasma capsulatum G186AR]|uniref:HNH nuclease domain-containing protein n=1 Tax=Ajellomyces capsulatus TaxID=5037 RepID=A0A8H8D014_AJECA|nr:hypothetical protein I7I52_06405 [Histoplasma capsulatum]QSS73935.1 hypothetical protein I7I50_08889 [Histoplasma capsulatum G186AR]
MSAMKSMLSQFCLTDISTSVRVRFTPTITPSPLPEAEYRTMEVAAHMIARSPRYSQSKLKHDCFKRDNYRCMITGVYDYRHAPGNVPDSIIQKTGATDLVHILPFALGNYQTKIQEQQLARVWESLNTCFPGIRSHTNLSADTINDYSNLMTLEASLHTVFGNFEIALDPTSEENSYRMMIYRPIPTLLLEILPQPNENNERIIKFEKHADYELPNRVLLGTHAAVAKILHATGMAETIEKILRDREELLFLAEDGSTDLKRLLLLAY